MQDEDMDVTRSAPRWGTLPCGRYLLFPLSGNKEVSKELTVLRVRPTPVRLTISILYTTMDSMPLQSMLSVLFEQ